MTASDNSAAHALYARIVALFKEAQSIGEDLVKEPPTVELAVFGGALACVLAVLRAIVDNGPPAGATELQLLSGAYAEQLREIADTLIRAGVITKEDVERNGVRFAVKNAFDPQKPTFHTRKDVDR